MDEEVKNNRHYSGEVEAKAVVQSKEWMEAHKVVMSIMRVGVPYPSGRVYSREAVENAIKGLVELPVVSEYSGSCFTDMKSAIAIAKNFRIEGNELKADIYPVKDIDFSDKELFPVGQGNVDADGTVYMFNLVSITI